MTWRKTSTLYAAVLLGAVAFFFPRNAQAASGLAPGRLEATVERAVANGKFLYVAFLGTGWSVSSQRFEEEVLQSPAFRQFAGEHLELFLVEARRKPKLTSEETAVLQSWVIHFDIQSYPTLILLAPDGQELLRHGYRDLTADTYVEMLRAVLPVD